MSLRRTVFIAAGVWIILVSLVHARINLAMRYPWEKVPDQAASTKRFRVGFLPVTCHLTCPVTHFINDSIEKKELFEPIRFSGWPELKEAFLSGHTEATFILAPMAMRLREEGVPIKIVYLGHRDGSAVMVGHQSGIYSTKDLKGKRVAVPNRYSNQRLLIFRALRDAGMTINDITLVEMPPPDMPAALYSKAVDAISSGEPFMGQTELDGYGRVLWLTKDVWPNFISCVLAVHEDTIKNDRETVQKLVDGIARSGKWIDKDMDSRMATAEFVSKNYYNQDPRLLRFVLSKPPDRVTYSNLALKRKDFEEIEELGRLGGILQGTAHFNDYCDVSFVPDDAQLAPPDFLPPAEYRIPLRDSEVAP